MSAITKPASPLTRNGIVITSDDNTRNTRDFFRIASFSTALGFGCAAGSLQSLRWNASSLSFELSLGTSLAFAVGAAAGWLYWKAAANNAASARKGSLLLAIVGVGLFLYPLRFVPKEKLPDIAIGLGLATLALSTAAWLIWQVTRFLEQDSRQWKENSETAPRPPDKTAD